MHKDEIVRVFERWETEFRTDPGAFMTSEQLAAAAVMELAEARAEYFMRIAAAGSASDGTGAPNGD